MNIAADLTASIEMQTGGRKKEKPIITGQVRHQTGLSGHCKIRAKKLRFIL